MTVLLDGKAASQALRSKLSIDLKKPPHVVFILVGNHPSSLSYVSIKKKTCEEVSIRSTICHLAEDISEKQLLMEISHLNSRDDVDGILVQLPLPQQIFVWKKYLRRSTQKKMSTVYTPITWVDLPLEIPQAFSLVHPTVSWNSCGSTI